MNDKLPFDIHFDLPIDTAENFTTKSPFYNLWVNANVACQGIGSRRLNNHDFSKVYLAAQSAYSNILDVLCKLEEDFPFRDIETQKFIMDILEARRARNETSNHKTS